MEYIFFKIINLDEDQKYYLAKTDFFIYITLI